MMRIDGLAQRRNILQLKLTVTNDPHQSFNCLLDSKEYEINCVAVFQVRVIANKFIIANSQNKVYINSVLVRFFKRHSDQDNLTYRIQFTCNEFAIVNKMFTCDDGTWHLIYENRDQIFSFEASINMDVVPKVNSFAALHEDHDLTDYELRGTDGAICVHKAVLAASSSVLHRMLCGTWKETTEGYIDLPETSRLTLENLKRFIYLGTLPDTGLEELMVLASCYMMSDLEQKCVDKVVQTMTPQNAWKYLDFASKNHLAQLTLAVLESVQNGEVQVKDIRMHSYEDNVLVNRVIKKHGVGERGLRGSRGRGKKYRKSSCT